MVEAELGGTVALDPLGLAGVVAWTDALGVELLPLGEAGGVPSCWEWPATFAPTPVLPVPPPTVTCTGAGARLISPASWSTGLLPPVPEGWVAPGKGSGTGEEDPPAG